MCRSPFGQLGSTQDGPTQLLQVAYVNIVEVSSSLKESHTRTVTHRGVSRDGRPRVLPYSGSYRNRQSDSGSALLSDRRVFSTLLYEGVKYHQGTASPSMVVFPRVNLILELTIPPHTSMYKCVHTCIPPCTQCGAQERKLQLPENIMCAQGDSKQGTHRNRREIATPPTCHVVFRLLI